MTSNPSESAAPEPKLAVRWRQIRSPVRSKLTWGRLYHATSYLKSALWTVPLFAIALEFLLAPALRALDTWLRWRIAELAPAGATALYQTVITMTLSFLVFTFGSLLVAIQVASGQLTPRIIATILLRNNVVRYSVGLYVFTLVFAVQALNRQEASVGELVSLVTGILGVACIADFLFLIDYAARLLRPVSVVARVGDEGVAMIKSVYPDPATALTPEAAALPERRRMPSRNSRASGHARKLSLPSTSRRWSRWRRLHDGMIELVPQVGDFVAVEEPLFVLYGGAMAIDDRIVRSAVAFGPERTLEQDPMFAFRIIVDIALKALSPAINDPTTAVLAFDQVHRLLRLVGRRSLRGEVILDDFGRPRLIFRTPNWEHYVQVACQRNSRLRRQQPAGGTPHARNARKSPAERCRSTAVRRWTRSSTCWIRRSRRTSVGPRNSNWRAFPTCRGWAGRRPRVLPISTRPWAASRAPGNLDSADVRLKLAALCLIVDSPNATHCAPRPDGWRTLA